MYRKLIHTLIFLQKLQILYTNILRNVSHEKRKIKIAEIKDSLIETINENLKKRKWALVQIERDLLNRTNLTREELITIGKELAKEYKKAGYQILAEKEYSENNYYKFYSFRIEF